MVAQPDRSNQVPTEAFATAHSVSLVVPAYNEEAAIESVIRGFKHEFDGRVDYEIIVVDNNSTDKTAEIAISLGARVVREERQGYGFACIRGLKEATADVIVLAEGDNTFEPRDVWKLLVYLQEPDIDLVLGTRTTKELVDPGAKMTWLLHWGNLLLAKSIQAQFWGRCRLTDVGCTFRAVKRSSLESIIGDLNEGGPSFSPVMIICTLKRNLKIVEVPIRYRNRLGHSKITANTRKSVRVGMQMFERIATQAFW